MAGLDLKSESKLESLEVDDVRDYLEEEEGWEPNDFAFAFDDDAADEQARALLRELLESDQEMAERFASWEPR